MQVGEAGIDGSGMAAYPEEAGALASVGSDSQVAVEDWPLVVFVH